MDNPLCAMFGRNGEFLTTTTDVEATNFDQTDPGRVFGIFDSTSGEGNNARIKINVHTSGTYYISVADADVATGTYTLVVNRTN